MALLTMYIGILSLVATGALASPMDKYQDALEKYSKWVEKYSTGGQRSQRNTDITSYLFAPHRPSVGPLKAPAVSSPFLRELDQDLELINNVRSVRNNEVEPSNSIYNYPPLRGLLPHQKRKSYPYYGRRRRSAAGAAGLTAGGWTILDPVTGRQILEPIGIDAQLRSVRKPGDAEISTSISYTEFKDEHGQIQPIYKYYKKNPHGYSG